MLTAPIPPDEGNRLAALHRYDVLDTEAEPAFDDIVWLASDICRTPMAFVSLVDAQREFFKAGIGGSVREAPRDISFCGHTILDDGVLLVPDALLDSRFADNPQVTASRPVRFYAGAPLITPDGFRIGALCVKDSEPREIGAEELRALEALGRQVVAQLELRRLLVESVASAAGARRLAAIVDSSNDAIIATTKTGEILSWNPAAERLYGYAGDEAVGRSIMSLVPRSKRIQLGELLNRVAEGVRVDHEETQRIRKDGEKVDISAALSPVLDERGEITGVSIIDHDLSERRSLAKAKRDFVASVTHELRTPLTSIIGSAEMLAEDREILNGDQQRFLRIIDGNAQRLLALISDILALAESENVAAFRPERVNLRDLVFKVVDEQSITSTGRGHELVVVVPEEPVSATVDPTQMTQVVSNLLANAIKYTPDGGKIEIALTVDDAGTASVSVKDSGIGIAESDVPRLTERFFRAASATDAGIPGTGLGLAICAGIAEAHQGRLSVTSELGHGSQFTVSFPLDHPSRRSI